MATRNVAVSREESKRVSETVEAAKREMQMAAAELAVAGYARDDVGVCLGDGAA